MPGIFVRLQLHDTTVTVVAQKGDGRSSVGDGRSSVGDGRSSVGDGHSSVG